MNLTVQIHRIPSPFPNSKRQILSLRIESSVYRKDCRLQPPMSGSLSWSLTLEPGGVSDVLVRSSHSQLRRGLCDTAAAPLPQE